MNDLLALAKLIEAWETINEDPGKWVGRSPKPLTANLAELRDMQLRTGAMIRVQFMCGGICLFSITSSTSIDTESALSFFGELSLENQDDLNTLCLKISDAAADGKPSARLGQHVHNLCAAMALAELDPQVVLLVDKHTLSGLTRIDGWQTTVWLTESAFSTWLCSQAVVEAYSLFNCLSPSLVIVPSHGSGTPYWMVTPEELAERMEHLLLLGQGLQQRYQKRAVELSLRSKGPLVLPEILDGASPTWLSKSPPFGTLLGYIVLTAVASDFELRDHRLTHTVRNRDHVIISEFGFWPDRLQLDNGRNLNIDSEVVEKWLTFLRYYRQTRDEARRYVPIWQAALERVCSESESTAAVLTDTERLTGIFHGLRDTLLNENLEKALGAAERAETMLGQLAAQFNRDVESLGTDAEHLAVASITSGIVGLSGALFRAESFSFVGPVATAFVFLWYFPIVFRRLAYLRRSIELRARDFEHALASIRHTAGDFIEGNLYIDRFGEHKDAALAEVAGIKQRMLWTLVVLHAIAVGVPAYLGAIHGMTSSLWIAAGAVLTYTAWIVRDGTLPRWSRVVFSVLTVVLVLVIYRVR